MDYTSYCGEENNFLLRKHLKLIRTCLDVLPSDYAVFQSTKPTILFFMLSGLDVLGQLDAAIDQRRRAEMIEWVYALQFPKCGESRSSSSRRCGGFRGCVLSSPSTGLCPYESAHLAQTYTSLCILLILGDDFSRLDRCAILRAVADSQGEDGSFFDGDRSNENDMRFLYCACAICYLLDDFSPINIPSLLDFVRRSVNYDGGIAQGPSLESHGGSTFCAISSLFLVGHLWDGSVLDSGKIERLKTWSLLKQEEGFHGRTNKLDDSCYSFWVGATLAMLNALPLVDWPVLRSFLLRVQDATIGGFRRDDDAPHSDLLHTYFSLAALGIFNEPCIRPLFVPLNISTRTYEHWQRIRRQWHNGMASGEQTQTRRS